MAGGRPTKYKRQYCAEIIAFFDKPPYTEVEVITTDRRSGKEYVDHILRPTILPTLERFGHNIDVNIDTLHDWGEVHPEFLRATTRARSIQKDILIANGLSGLYNSSFAIFVSGNLTDLQDVKHIDHTSKGQPMPLLGGTTPMIDDDEPDAGSNDQA